MITQIEHEAEISFLIRNGFLFQIVKPGPHARAGYFIGFKSFVHINEIVPVRICVFGWDKPLVFQDSAIERNFIRSPVARIRMNYQRTVMPCYLLYS